MQQRLGGGGLAHLGHVGRAEHHHPGRLVALYDGAVDGRHDVGEQPGAVGGGQPGDVGAERLDDDRYPAQRAVGQAGLHLGTRGVEPGGDHRVELGVEPLDTGDRGLEHLGGAGGTGADVGGQGERVAGRGGGVGHGVASRGRGDGGTTVMMVTTGTTTATTATTATTTRSAPAGLAAVQRDGRTAQIRGLAGAQPGDGAADVGEGVAHPAGGDARDELGGLIR